MLHLFLPWRHPRRWLILLVVMSLTSSHPWMHSSAAQGSLTFTLLGQHTLPAFARDVAVVGEHAYVIYDTVGSGSPSGVQILAIRDPATPVLTGTYLMRDRTRFIWWSGGRLRLLPSTEAPPIPPMGEDTRGLCCSMCRTRATRACWVAMKLPRAAAVLRWTTSGCICW